MSREPSPTCAARTSRGERDRGSRDSAGAGALAVVANGLRAHDRRSCIAGAAGALRRLPRRDARGGGCIEPTARCSPRSSSASATHRGDDPIMGVRHVVRRRDACRRARVAAATALHRRAGLRLDGALHRAARPRRRATAIRSAVRSIARARAADRRRQGARRRRPGLRAGLRGRQRLRRAHPELRLYRNDGAPESLGDLLQIMDPANEAGSSTGSTPTAGRRRARLQRLPPRHLRLSARAR